LETNSLSRTADSNNDFLCTMVVHFDSDGITNDQDFFISFSDTSGLRVGVRRQTDSTLSVVTPNGVAGIAGGTLNEGSAYIITMVFRGGCVLYFILMYFCTNFRKN